MCYVSRSGDLSWPFQTGVTLPRGIRNAIEFSHTFSRPKNVPKFGFHILDEHVSRCPTCLAFDAELSAKTTTVRPLPSADRSATTQDAAVRQPLSSCSLPALQNEMPPQGRIDVRLEVDDPVRLLARPESRKPSVQWLHRS
jgi:hypothetical protein